MSSLHHCITMCACFVHVYGHTVPAWADWSCWLGCVSCCFLRCYWMRCQPSFAFFFSSLLVWLLPLSINEGKGVRHKYTTPKYSIHLSLHKNNVWKQDLPISSHCQNNCDSERITLCFEKLLEYTNVLNLLSMYCIWSMCGYHWQEFSFPCFEKIMANL